MRSCFETLVFAVLVLVFAWLAEGCAAVEKIADIGCKAACFTCNTGCPLVRDAMQGAQDDAGGEDAEEPTPEPTPPPEGSAPPLRTWDGALAGGSR